MVTIVKSVRRANDIIEKLSEMDEASVSALSEELDIPISSVYDYTKTLEELGFVTELPSGKYRLSTRFLNLGNKIRYNYELYTVAKSKQEDLAWETGAYVPLMIEEHGLGVLIGMEKGKHASNVLIENTFPGIRMTLNNTSVGKAILASLPEERVAEIVDKYGLDAKTSQTIADEEELCEELELIREQGYAIDDEERLAGMRGIGVAMESEPDQTVGAIGIYGPANKYDLETLHGEVANQVLEVANVIQVTLDYA